MTTSAKPSATCVHGDAARQTFQTELSAPMALARVVPKLRGLNFPQRRDDPCRRKGDKGQSALQSSHQVSYHSCLEPSILEGRGGPRTWE